MTIPFVPRRQRQSWLAAFLAALVLASSSCVRNPQVTFPDPLEAHGEGTHLPRAAPSEVGVDAGPLERMLHYLTSTKTNVHAILVLRHGKLILEAYAYPHRATDRHALYSCTKSVTSIITGIAIADGLIPGVEARVVDLFPERKIAGRDGPKGAVTLRDLLTMQGGFDWNEWPYSGPDNSLDAMVASADPTQYVLDRPMRFEPGKAFNYNTGSSQLIGAVVQQRTGKKLAAFAQEKLFGPLGIADFSWYALRDGSSWGGTGLQLRPEDMAKLGQLYLDHGTWQGKQLVPASWVAESTTKFTPKWDANSFPIGYGYQWWMTEQGYTALGSGGQAILVNPAQDLVAVVVSSLEDSSATGAIGILLDLYVAPAVRDGGSTGADEKLRAAIAAFERKPEAKPIALPSVARSVSGASFALEDGSRFSIAYTDGSEAVATFSSPKGSCTFPIGLDGVPRVSDCDPSWPWRGPAAFTGWFEGDVLLVRHAAIDAGNEFIYRMEMSEDRMELSGIARYNGAVVYRTRGKRER